MMTQSRDARGGEADEERRSTVQRVKLRYIGEFSTVRRVADLPTDPVHAARPTGVGGLAWEAVNAARYDCFFFYWP
ncbi:hypothetical protein HYQ46_009749 [Verticillium longisporum]|nr:hypothetical protein HYQ46_009749 [Verticillium longisporum]